MNRVMHVEPFTRDSPLLNPIEVVAQPATDKRGYDKECPQTVREPAALGTTGNHWTAANANGCFGFDLKSGAPQDCNDDSDRSGKSTE